MAFIEPMHRNKPNITYVLVVWIKNGGSGPKLVYCSMLCGLFSFTLATLAVPSTTEVFHDGIPHCGDSAARVAIVKPCIWKYRIQMSVMFGKFINSDVVFKSDTLIFWCELCSIGESPNQRIWWKSASFSLKVFISCPCNSATTQHFLTIFGHMYCGICLKLFQPKCKCNILRDIGTMKYDYACDEPQILSMQPAAGINNRLTNAKWAVVFPVNLNIEHWPKPGARPTQGISIQLEIRSKFGLL